MLHTAMLGHPLLVAATPQAPDDQIQSLLASSGADIAVLSEAAQSSDSKMLKLLEGNKLF